MRLTDLKRPFDQLTVEEQINLLEQVRSGRVPTVKRRKAKGVIAPRSRKPTKRQLAELEQIDKLLALAESMLNKDK